ncbi:MAG TPA: PDZ domain-containing protein [Thermoanaerobaculia bacterium]|nr:PDZ domain-containing protein [Thermoanaerobaculia bacterium]
MRSQAPAALLCLAGSLWGCVAAAAQEPGTTGLRVIQLYDDTQANKRGNLVVVDVWAQAPGAAAGVQKGDVIVAIDGSPVVGKDALAAFKSELRGPAGGKVRLSLVRVAEDNREFEVTLERSAYPLRENPAAQPFSFSMPRSWRFEGFEFPLPWSPQIAYHGTEDIAFAPDFDDQAGGNYHSLVWFWWLEGRPEIDAASLRADLLQYFRGLSQERGRNYHFTPRLDQVAVTVAALPAAAAPAAAYRGDAVTFDTHGQLITLHFEVEERACTDAGRTALLFNLSPQPLGAPIWSKMQAIRSTFRCRRAP